MSQKEAREFAREFKVEAVRRMLAGENVSHLAKELGVLRKDLYVWRARFRSGGVAALRPRGRPRKQVQEVPQVPACLETPLASQNPPLVGDVARELAAARARIAALEQKVGRQALELDFFRTALRHFKETRPQQGKTGVKASTPSSEP